MTESTKKKSEPLEPDEDEFYIIFGEEIERFAGTIVELVVDGDNLSTRDKAIEEKLDTSRNRIRVALLALLVAYYIRGTRQAEKQLGNQPIIFNNEDLRVIQIIERNANNVVDNILIQLKNNILGLDVDPTKNLQSAIDSALVRARMVAATESMFARNQAMLHAYRKRGGIFFVKWIAIKDERLCPICREGMDIIYVLAESFALIPAHPYCRCHWEPIIRVEQVVR